MQPLRGENDHNDLLLLQAIIRLHKIEHTDLSFVSDPAMAVSMLSKGLFDGLSPVVCIQLCLNPAKG